MDPIREDLKELRRDIREALGGLQESVHGLGEKLSTHALEDADREGKVSAELGIMSSRLSLLSAASDDRHKFFRGWVAGIVAVAIAAGVGFLFRSAIETSSRVPFVITPEAK